MIQMIKFNQYYQKISGIKINNNIFGRNSEIFVIDLNVQKLK